MAYLVFEGQNSTSSQALLNSRSNIKALSTDADKGDLDFNYFSLEDKDVQDVVEDLDSKLGIQNRKNNDEESKDKDVNPVEDKKVGKDPIKWFGVLVPSMLRQTQKTFVRSLELSIDCVNIQSQIESNIARKNLLLDQLNNK